MSGVEDRRRIKVVARLDVRHHLATRIPKANVTQLTRSATAGRTRYFQLAGHTRRTGQRGGIQHGATNGEACPRAARD